MLIDFVISVALTAILLLFVYRQRRSSIGGFRVWFTCEGLPLGLAVWVVLALILLALELASR